MKTSKVGDKVQLKKIRKHQIDFVYTVEQIRKEGKEVYLGNGTFCWIDVSVIKKYKG